LEGSVIYATPLIPSLLVTRPGDLVRSTAYGDIGATAYLLAGFKLNIDFLSRIGTWERLLLQLGQGCFFVFHKSQTSLQETVCLVDFLLKNLN